MRVEVAASYIGEPVVMLPPWRPQARRSPPPRPPPAARRSPPAPWAQPGSVPELLLEPARHPLSPRCHAFGRRPLPALTAAKPPDQIAEPEVIRQRRQEFPGRANDRLVALAPVVGEAGG